MKKIVFPTDFSENAAQAFPFAIELAKKFNAVIYILHTYQVPYHRSDMFVSLTDIMKKDAEEGVARVIAEAGANPATTGIQFEQVIRVGDVADAITDLVSDENIDMVVMGTTGATGLEEVFLGTNAAAVISKSEVPVLCIPPASVWKAPERICLAFDMQETSSATIEPLKKLCGIFNSEVLVLNIATDDNSGARTETARPLGELLADVRHEFIQTQGDEVEPAILNFTASYLPDWISMIHHKRGFFERIFGKSLTRKVAYHTNIPLLTLPELQNS